MIQSIAVVSLLVASPSNAFVTTSLPLQQCCEARRPSSSHRISSFDSSSFSSSSAASDENGSSSQQQKQQQRQESNAQQEWLGGSSRHQSDEASSLDEMDTRPATSYLPPPPQQQQLRRHSSSSDDTNENTNEHYQRSSEFNIHESPLPTLSTKRRERLEREHKWQSSYEFIPPGTNTYWDLKDTIYYLQEDYEAAVNAKLSLGAIRNIRNMLFDARSKDPEYIYGKTNYYLQNNAVDRKRGVGNADDVEEKVIEHKNNKEQNRAARQRLPQFNLEGLWVGK